MAKIKINWMFVIIALLLAIAMQDNVTSQAVADVEGQACLVDEDCPCWGEITTGNQSIKAFGIGTAKCVENACVTSGTCFDVQPIGEWIKDKPLAWVTDPSNALAVAVIIILIILAFTFPKR